MFAIQPQHQLGIAGASIPIVILDPAPALHGYLTVHKNGPIPDNSQSLLVISWPRQRRPVLETMPTCSLAIALVQHQHYDISV